MDRCLRVHWNIVHELKELKQHPREILDLLCSFFYYGPREATSKTGSIWLSDNGEINVQSENKEYISTAPKEKGFIAVYAPKEYFKSREYFCALKSDGSIITWGAADRMIPLLIKTVFVSIAPTTHSIAVLDLDGNVFYVCRGERCRKLKWYRPSRIVSLKINHDVLIPRIFAETEDGKMFQICQNW